MQMRKQLSQKERNTRTLASFFMAANQRTRLW